MIAPHHQDRSVKAVLAQRNCSLRAAVAGSDNHYIGVIHAPSSHLSRLKGFAPKPGSVKIDRATRRSQIG
jgi:hypothetical protein